MKISMQTKLIGLIISLLFFVIILLTSVFTYIQSKQTEQHMGQLALKVATTVSFMSEIKTALYLDNPSLEIDPIVEKMRKEIGAEYIIVGNKDSIRYSHPQKWKIGKKMVGGDNDKALVDGKYYISKAKGSLGPALRGKAPIFDETGNIIGIVSVGFMLKDVQSAIIENLIPVIFFSFITLLLGGIGGILLARNIRKDILGLEPNEIAALYREHNAILLSIKEGIIAVDEKGFITVMNNSAREILGVEDNPIKQPIEKVLPNLGIRDFFESGTYEKDKEMILKNRMVIVNRTPIIEKGKVLGIVASFRDKTEMSKMINTLSEVRKYSEDLRAQTHEFTNKLYVISGLLQLGQYKEAIDLIQLESSINNIQNRILFEQIQDKKVQAILLGKISKASEKKIDFSLDETSYLKAFPKHIDISKLITILGNIIDNAFEAAYESQQREVSFFATDMGNDVVFEVVDSGPGIKADEIKNIFKKGYSTKKGDDRGYGLSIVKEVVEDLGGMIEVQNKKEGGTVFSVFLPKK